MASQKNFTILIFLCITILYCHSGQSDAATLPDNEIESLKIIAQAIGKGDWDFNGDPCGFDGVICSDVNITVRQITNITLGSRNLTGVLPPELGSLTRLEELDLADNHLTGSIPPLLGSLTFLKILSLSSNLLSGSVPEELGDLSELVELKIHTNNLSGVIPQEIWRLTMLEKLHLSSNQFIGEIFPTGVNLHNLKEFWASSNHFNGTIPSVIGNLTGLKTLRLQGTLLEGPIPNISNLNDLEDLRISDVQQGGHSVLNFVLSLKNLRTLVLRNNNITAAIPDGLEKLYKLETLDLSFNNLNGPIPDPLPLSKLNFLFLGNNSLTGNPPSWLSQSDAKIDLSYNNLSGNITSDLLNNPNLNLIWNSLKPPNNDRTWVGCLQRNSQCSNKPRNYGMAINCGGKKLKFSAKNFIFHEFEDDTDQEELVYRKQWGVTNVGYFMDNENETKTQYTVQGDASFTRDKDNSSVNISDIEQELYKTARVSPLSLRYYGLDLQPGIYNVELHFVEIQFPNNRTSKGVRIFDVYIQGERVLKDFNIRETAGNKNLVVKNYHINVTQKVLEIHFFWAGKGTCCEPLNGTYGPLISAITVVPLFEPDIPKKSKTVMIVIIVVVIVILALLLALSIVFYNKRKKGENMCSCHREEREMETLESNFFSLRMMKIATKNFDPKSKIGEGGFGVVYKGVLQDGRKVAIKQLSSQSKQGNREFLNEVGTISAVQHPHLVKLYGCCVEEEELLLVYEYMENGNLSQALFGHDESRVKLDWPTRYRICVGVARGLAHLHEESLLKIVHRDIKSTNILLDKDLNPKVADFGLARLFDEENTHVSTRVAGTIGYMAPEYALKGHLTDKADVYSFGVVVLEIVSGRTHTDMALEEERTYLLEWAWQLYEGKKMLELVDTYLLHSGYNEEEVVRMIHVGLLCTHENPGRRPSMSAVVDMLEGRKGTPAPQSRPVYLNHWQTWQLAVGVHHQQTQSSTSKSSAHQGPWKGSSSNSKEDLHSL